MKSKVEWCTVYTCPALQLSQLGAGGGGGVQGKVLNRCTHLNPGNCVGFEPNYLEQNKLVLFYSGVTCRLLKLKYNLFSMILC